MEHHWKLPGQESLMEAQAKNKKMMIKKKKKKKKKKNKKRGKSSRSRRITFPESFH